MRALVALSWAMPPLAAAKPCLPALAEEGRRLHEMPRALPRASPYNCRGTQPQNRENYVAWGRINPLV